VARASIAYPQLMADDEGGGETEKLGLETAIRTGIVAHCASCGCERAFLRHRVRHPLHFFATLLSVGLWLVPWLAICFGGVLRPWRCKNCGWHKPEFRVPLEDALRMGEAALHGSRARHSLAKKAVI